MKNANNMGVEIKLIEDDVDFGKSSNEEAQEAYEIGSRLMYGGRLDEAQSYLMKAVTLDPAFMLAIDHLGVVYRRKGMLEEAEKLYLKSIELYGKNSIPYKNLAVVYQQMGKFDAAAGMYKKVYELDPEDPESYYGMGTLYQLAGEYETSIKYFDIAIAKYSAKGSELTYDAVYNQGINYYRMNEGVKALICLEIAQKAFPNDARLQRLIDGIKEGLAGGGTA